MNQLATWLTKERPHAFWLTGFFNPNGFLTSTLQEVASAGHEKLLLVIGGEDRSVGQFILNMAEDVVGIQQHGKVNSLNASVAAGIAMFALGQAK